MGFSSPPLGNFLDHNIIVPTCLWVRKMHVSTRIKGAFGDYGLLYQTASNRQNSGRDFIINEYVKSFFEHVYFQRYEHAMF